MIKNFLNWIKTINIKDIYSFRNQVPIKEVNYGIDDISKKEDYRIAISQNGKFIVTFDTANLRIKILENKDHRPFTSSKKEVNSNDNNKYCGLDNLDELDDIGQTITYFKINNDFMIEKFYKEEYKPSLFEVDSLDSDIINASDFEWSIDISNMQEINDGGSFILIAISHINVNMDMRRTENKKIDNKKNDYKKENLNKIRFKCSSLSEKYELKDEGNKPDEACDIAINMKPRPTNKIMTCHYSNQISGICRFIDDSSKDDSKSLNDSRIKRFIILNFRGIYNFEFDDHFDSFNLNEKFEYPTNIRRELDIWYTDNCMKRLLSCIYDKYFFVPQYKNDVLLLKVYDLAKMELETTIKKSKNKNYFTLNSNDNAFSFSRLQLCFTRGNNTIRLYYIKNGLEVAFKSFKEIERIYLLEFIENDEKLLIIGKEQKLKEINENKEMNKEEKEKRKQEIIEIIDKNEGIKVKRKEKRFKSSNHLANNYIRIHEYEKMFSYIEHIVWKFAKYEPENFRLLDVRYNVMKNLILGDCDYLIKFILFGDEEETTESSVVRHIPNSELWPGKMFLRDDDLDFDESNDMLIGRELKDTNAIAYFLEYYSRRATNYADWMCTVSKAIPLLFKYNYDDYARKLFSRECFINQDHSLIQDSNEIIPRVYLERRNHNIKFRAFSPIVKLKSIKYGWYDYWIRTPFKSLYDSIIKLKNDIVIMYENFDNELGKSTLALRVVPLPGFTTNNIVEKKVETILCENDDTHDIYDNPAIEAVINFQWQKAKNFFFSLFIRFLVFATCFGVVLLKDPANIRMKDSTYSGVATNSLTNETFNIKLKSDFDPKSDDNPFTSFSKAIMAAYFWTSNIWVQIDRFDFWAVDSYTFIASIFLVFVLQNMLIAFMSGVYESVTATSRLILLRHQANFIADYEALHHIHLWSPEPEPKHIYYYCQTKTIEEWYNVRKDGPGLIYKDIEEKFIDKHVFKEKDYDKFSILECNDDNNIKKRIENFKNIGNEMNNNIEYLIKRFKSKNLIEEIEEIEEINDMKIDLKANVEKLYHKLEKMEKYEIL
uniref:Ion transport domain-containing protein n=1 Tax=Rhizophagus irregularis (strain DAOM 181602 / DAOM 197198 / MUCL 43194) TaxID=747089 RepID=U9UIS9_RHIID